jgi:hypothetical protein
MIFHEHDFGGAAAEGFDANRAGSREKVNESGASDTRAQNIEDGFAQFVAGGTQRETLKALQDSTAISSGDDAHDGSY